MNDQPHPHGQEVFDNTEPQCNDSKPPAVSASSDEPAELVEPVAENKITMEQYRGLLDALDKALKFFPKHTQNTTHFKQEVERETRRLNLSHASIRDIYDRLQGTVASTWRQSPAYYAVLFTQLESNLHGYSADLSKVIQSSTQSGQEPKSTEAAKLTEKLPAGELTETDRHIEEAIVKSYEQMITAFQKSGMGMVVFWNQKLVQVPKGDKTYWDMAPARGESVVGFIHHIKNGEIVIDVSHPTEMDRRNPHRHQRIRSIGITRATFSDWQMELKYSGM